MLRVKILLCLDDLFITEKLYHFHARFNVALSLCMIMTVMLSGWSLPRLLLAFTRTKRIYACASKLLFKPVVPFESTIPTYMWYLPATPNLDFNVPSRNLFKIFPFVTVQAHGALRGNQYLACQKYFDGSFN